MFVCMYVCTHIRRISNVCDMNTCRRPDLSYETGGTLMNDNMMNGIEFHTQTPQIRRCEKLHRNKKDTDEMTSDPTSVKHSFSNDTTLTVARDNTRLPFRERSAEKFKLSAKKLNIYIMFGNDGSNTICRYRSFLSFSHL